MITLFEAVKLASLSYELTNDDCDDYKYLKNSNDLIGVQGGYFSKIFVKHDQKIIIVSHRGTELRTIEQESCNGTTDNLTDDSNIYFKRILNHISEAIRLVNILKTQYSNYIFIQTGHSLGGCYAHLIGYHYKDKVISFDNPGWEELLMKGKKIDYSHLNTNHFSFLAKINLINGVNSHLGRMFTAKEDDVGIYNSSQLTSNTIKFHGLEKFFKLVSQEENVSVFDFSKESYGFFELDKSFIFTGPEEEIPSQRSKVTTGNFNHKEWMVSKVNLNNSLSPIKGHIAIVVEGIKKTEHNTFEKFVGHYDLSLRDGSVIIRCLETPGYTRNYSKFKFKTSQLLDAQMVLLMISSIKEEVEISKEKANKGESIYTYSVFGSGSVFASDNNSENCVTWAEKKLEIAGWNKSLFEQMQEPGKKIASIPKKTTKSTCIIS